MKFSYLMIFLGVVAGCIGGEAAASDKGTENITTATLPSPMQERVIGDYLSAFNSGKMIAMLDFVHKHVPKERRPPDADMRAKYQGQFMTWGSLTPGAEHGFARPMKATALNEWLLMTFHFSEVDPQKMLAIETDPVPAPGEAVPTTEAEALARIQTMLENFSSNGFFSGVVLVAHKDKVLLSKAFGQANDEKHIANRLDTQFNLASVTKMFTAVAIAQLKEQGKLSYSDTIKKHLPNYPSSGDTITIDQLLTHTSGLENIDGPKFFHARDRLNSPQAFIDYYASDPLLFKPGAKWQYSNLGYIVLGRIIEVISGQSYDEYVNEHIFQKAEMHDTGSFALDEQAPNRACGYTDISPDKYGWPGPRTPGKRFNSARYYFLSGTPAGYFFSTAPDLLRFSQALTTGKLLEHSTTDEITMGKVAMFGAGEKYGYGIMEGHVHGARWFGHTGGGPGVSTFFSVLPEKEYTVIVLANVDAPAAEWVTQRINGYLIFSDNRTK